MQRGFRDRALASVPEQAIRQMRSWLSEPDGWTVLEACIFLKLVSDLRPGQIMAGTFTMRLRIEKQKLPNTP